VRLACLALGVTAGCLHEASQHCSNGGICPPGLICMDTEDTTEGGRICAVGTCGNARLDPGEMCDDGNNRSGDGCPADCMQACGDGVADPGEVCDDGNTVDGDGCSADCLLRDGDLLVSPPMVGFAVTEGDPLPPAVTVTVRFEYLGDSVLAGYAPGVAQATWLSIAEGPSSGRAAELQLRVNDTTVVGQRSTTIRVMIFHHSSAGVASFDLPVTYDVASSDLAVQATPPTLALAAAVGDILVPSHAVNVAFNGEDIALVSAPSWLAVSDPPGPGPATSPASFTVRVASTSFAAGTVLSGDLVFRSTRPRLQRTTSVHVEYSVLAPPAIAISATPGTLAFTAVSGGAVPPPQTVDVAFTGATIEVAAAPPWVTVSGPVGPATSPASFTVSANTTSFAGGTVQSGDVVFTTARGSESSATVHIDYSVEPVLVVQFAAPYVGLAGRAGRLIVRGRGFPARPVTVAIGNVQLGPVTPDSSTQITLSYPPLPEGRYSVALVDPSWTSPTAPELVIAAPTPFTYQAIEAPGVRYRIVYDAERQAIYGVNTIGQQIEHFAYSNGSWSVVPPHIIPQLTDIAMTPDGRSLIVVDQGAISDMSLTDGLFARVERVVFPGELFSCEFFAAIAVANNGKAFVRSGDGRCMAHFYDVIDHSLTNMEMYDDGSSAASGDGSRIYATGGGNYRIYDSLSGTLSSSPIVGGSGGLSVGDDASRVLAIDTWVFDRALSSFLGELPFRGQNAALVSRDSTRAFVYSQDDAGARIEVFDLSSPAVPGGLYNLLKTVTMPDKANRFSGNRIIRMASSLDDAVVFVSGETRMLVVPVD